MFGFLRRMFHGGGLGTLWCSCMHDSPMWPIREHYECRTCGRQYRVPWAEPERTGAPRVRQAPLPSLGSAMVPTLLLMAVLGRPSLRRQSIASDSSAAAPAVLEHFVATQSEAARWPEETIEIEASLPKVKKTGRLSAIRRLLAAGHPDYRVLWIAGDSTGTKEVIVRYVSADARAKEANLKGRFQTKSLRREVQRLLNARTGVIEECQ
jgi:hypothetical protein